MPPLLRIEAGDLGEPILNTKLLTVAAQRVDQCDKWGSVDRSPRRRQSKWPALAKMVKQYFAAPASSAGVERVFSAAGKMHGDLQKSAKDSTLEHSLFAAFNTD